MKGEAKAALISVVVPVYMVENTLDACVQSILAQTLSNIEVVLVDDGSPDLCGEMCDRWAERDSRVKVLHKANGGLSDARNAGVSVASAPYVGFVDSDDTVDPEMFEVLYGNMVESGADLSLCGVASHYPKKTVLTKDRGKCVVSGKEALRLALTGEIPGIWAVARLYPKELAKRVPFPKGRNFEDAFVTADMYISSPKVVIDSRPLYHYWHRGDSITGGKVSRKALDQVDAFEHMTSRALAAFPELQEEARFRLLWSRFDVLDRFAGVNGPLDEEQRELRNELISYLRRHWTCVLANPYFGKGRKASMLLLAINPSWYFAMVRKRDRSYG